MKSGQSELFTRQPTVFFFFSAPLLCWQPMHACPTDTGNGRISSSSSSSILHSFIHSFIHSLTHFIHRFSEACHTDCQLATAFSAQLDTALLSRKVLSVFSGADAQETRKMSNRRGGGNCVLTTTNIIINMQ